MFADEGDDFLSFLLGRLACGFCGGASRVEQAEGVETVEGVGRGGL